MSAVSSWVSGEVVPDDTAPAPSVAALELDIAKKEWDDGLASWWDLTPRELGERAERLWCALKTLRDSVGAE